MTTTKNTKPASGGKHDSRPNGTKPDRPESEPVHAQQADTKRQPDPNAKSTTPGNTSAECGCEGDAMETGASRKVANTDEDVPPGETEGNRFID